MGEKIVVGPINKGIRTDRLPFVIDNDSFPVLFNAYQWRGRVKRKRGTSILNRLKRFFNSTSTSYNSGSTTIVLSVAGTANLLTGFSLQINGNIVPGSVTITIGANVYTDPSVNGTLTGPNPGTINYASGSFTIALEAGNAASAKFNYYPDLPVMGLEDLILSPSSFPGTIGFDTQFSYNIFTTSPYNIYDVSFYKNPSTATYAGYTQKTNVTPTSWNGQDYQQFWTVNYQGAVWATNGINVPFSVTNIGMQFKAITGVVINAAGPPATATVTIVAHGLVQGDFVFINEVGGITGINFQTGYVISANPQAANTVQVEFPNATLGGAYTSLGIAQYLTNRSDITKDCLRWYDGDPTDGNASTPTLDGRKGWVNFCPPISNSNLSIADVPLAQYYLVGARVILPFKDRLLFFGPVIQSSSAGSQIYLQDTVIYSQNGTPYYTCSYTNTPNAAIDTPTSSTNVFNPILVPTNQTATSPAYFADVSGFGGFISVGNSQAITTVASNEDVLILGFTNQQARLVYTGNDVIPFNVFLINSEYGSSSTFSAINLDRGAISVGDRGIVMTSQVASQRIDLDIPDQIFEFNITNNGQERVTAKRDFINEWIYFTYLSNADTYKFPNQTLLYNYRDQSWGVFNECYTTYGQFKRVTGETWATIGTIFPSWQSWNEPWNSGSSTLLQPQVIGGNQQGFVLFRDDGTGEGNSLYIRSFSGKTVTSPDHCLNNGDYIVISGCLGTVGSLVNGNIFSVANATQNAFDLNPVIGSGTYLGGGVIKRMYVPFIQSKQFPVSWGMSRKTRIGVQQYLFTRTPNAQIELQIFLSMNSEFPYNFGNIVPSTNVTNNSLVYSDIVYTCPESTNLGLTAANINLNIVTGGQQEQIWHRLSTSLIGDVVQIAVTMSDSQMRDTTFSNQFSEIEMHGLIIDVQPSQVLA